MPCVGRTLLSDAFDSSLCQSKRNINSDGQECPSHTVPKTQFRQAYRSVAYCRGATAARLRGVSRGQALQEAVFLTQARNIVWRECGNRNSRQIGFLDAELIPHVRLGI